MSCAFVRNVGTGCILTLVYLLNKILIPQLVFQLLFSKLLDFDGLQHELSQLCWRKMLNDMSSFSIFLEEATVQQLTSPGASRILICCPQWTRCCADNFTSTASDDIQEVANDATYRRFSSFCIYHQKEHRIQDHETDEDMNYKVCMYEHCSKSADLDAH